MNKEDQKRKTQSKFVTITEGDMELSESVSYLKQKFNEKMSLIDNG